MPKAEGKFSFYTLLKINFNKLWKKFGILFATEGNNCATSLRGSFENNACIKIPDMREFKWRIFTMNIQEQESFEHEQGCDTELRNLFAQSKGEISIPKVSKEYVNWLSLCGFYVVISYCEMFCPFTDASLGTGEYLDLVTRNYEEVEHWVEWFEFHGEPYKVIPRSGEDSK